MTPLVLLLAAGIGADPLPQPMLLPPAPVPIATETTIDLKSYDPQPGDIIIFQTYGPVRRVATSTLYGGATHSSIIVPYHSGVAMLETPQVGYSVKLNDVHSNLQSYWGTLWVRRRSTPLTDEQATRLEAFARIQTGKPYDYFGWAKLLVSVPVIRISNRVPKDDEVMNRSSWLCSSLVGGACIYANLVEPAGLRPRAMAPADFLRDRIIAPSDGWSPAIRLVNSH